MPFAQVKEEAAQQPGDTEQKAWATPVAGAGRRARGTDIRIKPAILVTIHP